MKYQKIKMNELTGQDVLSGALDGKAAFFAMLDKTKTEPAQPSPLLIDFDGIEVATASYLREAVFALKTYLRARGSKLYPVVANANTAICDELAVIAEAKKEYLLVVGISPAGEVTNQDIIGQLDPKQATTFDRVKRLGRTTAGEMKDKFGAEEEVSAPTVWNNRLASLAAQGLILEYTQGRAKFYQPLFTEVN
jgi:hypothetical protein